VTLATAEISHADSGDMLPDAIIDPGAKPGHILVVDKAEQLLYLYKHENREVVLDRVMQTSTGEKKGDKLVEGDKKTPNGFYIFNQKFLPRELSPIYGTLAYPTDYPNFWDKKIGRGGYGIWLHGINKPLVDYDSNGCIELENADMARLEHLIELYETPILTYEELVLASVTSLQKEAVAIREFLESWRVAWVKKDHKTYKAKYAQNFVNSDNRSWAAFMAHKGNVARKYNNISVNLNDLKIYRHRDVFVAVFEQDYKGDNYFSSLGLKRLYLKNDGNSYIIVAEKFRPLPKTKTNKWLTAEERTLALETPSLTLAQAELEALAAEAEANRAAAEALEAETLRLAEAQAAKLAAEQEAEAARLEAARVALAQAAQEEARLAAKQEAEAAKLAAAQEAEAARLAALRLAEVQVAEKEQLTRIIQAWAKAWEKRDIEAYFAFYHPNFIDKTKQLNLGAFKNYRIPLIQAAQGIKVDISDVSIDLGNQASVRFKQRYRSHNFSDYGEKTLIFEKLAGKWQIISEDFRKL
ncbi:MAG: L,D-transpeptidase family protein, partial [Candidatus Adiutrix sp.]